MTGQLEERERGGSCAGMVDIDATYATSTEKERRGGWRENLRKW
jgi:hypothetical protein